MSLCGVIPVLKPAGVTSHDVVARVRGILGTKKVGHSGTLDPMVTGVLPVLVGNATKLSDYFMNVPKKYEAVAILGSSTNTQDAEGSVVAVSDAGHVRKSDVAECLQAFVGEIGQIPPDYSAVKLGGRKLMDYARNGAIIPEKKARKVRIYSTELLEFSNPRFSFSVLCSKGTYVRTLCHDIGEKLGTHAHMKKLVRTSSGGFEIGETISPEHIDAGSLISIDSAAKKIWNIGLIQLSDLPSDIIKKLKNGVKFDLGALGEVVCARERAASVTNAQEIDFQISEGYLVYLDGKLFGIADNARCISRVIAPALFEV